MLCYVFNVLIENGVYPGIFKKARIVPIHKSGNKHDVGNYRLISTLLILNKIFEKIIYQRINSFINTSGIISEYQYGFKKNSSTTLAVFNFITNIVETLKSKNMLYVCFLISGKLLIQ